MLSSLLEIRTERAFGGRAYRLYYKTKFSFTFQIFCAFKNFCGSVLVNQPTVHSGSRHNLKIYCFFISAVKTRPRQSVPNSGFHLVGPGLILVNPV